MDWKVKFTDVVLKALKKLDKKTAAMIISYIEKNWPVRFQRACFGGC